MQFPLYQGLTLLAIVVAIFIFPFKFRMPSLAAIRAANAAFSPSYIPVALFVGGTAGIGQGIVEAFARHLKGKAHIIIVGRNRAAAQSIISRLPKPTSGSNVTHEFVQCDATLMKNVDVVTKELLTRVPKINFLVMTAGYITTKGRDETEEGIDKKLAVHYYSRWKFINDLLPALKKAKEMGEDAKVLSVMAAGKGTKIDLDDLGLKKSYTLARAGTQAPTYNDLMVEVNHYCLSVSQKKTVTHPPCSSNQEYAARNPDLAFIHAYPGVVRTGLMASSDSLILRAVSSIVVPLSYPFSTSYAEAGEYMLHGLFDSTKGAFRYGSRGENLGMKKASGSEEARKRLWEHTVTATQL